MWVLFFHFIVWIMFHGFMIKNGYLGIAFQNKICSSGCFWIFNKPISYNWNAVSLSFHCCCLWTSFHQSQSFICQNLLFTLELCGLATIDQICSLSHAQFQCHGGTSHISYLLFSFLHSSLKMMNLLLLLSIYYYYLMYPNKIPALKV